jgi:hypothetical protein
MRRAFPDDCFYDLGVTDRFGSDLAITNQAFGTGIHPIVAFNLDYRCQHRRGALLGDLYKFFGQ